MNSREDLPRGEFKGVFFPEARITEAVYVVCVWTQVPVLGHRDDERFFALEETWDFE